MSPSGSSFDSNVANAVTATGPRKTYEKPVLELLGSVRDLTLGCTGGNLEGGRRKKPGAC
jgi:hypothetical protein